MVLTPDLRGSLRPAIVAFPLTVKSDAEITLLANLITLTPGTLSVDVSEDRAVLYVHVLTLDTPRGADRRDRQRVRGQGARGVRMSGAAVLEIATMVALVLLSLALLLSVVRIIIGPSLPDRVLALDLLTVVALGFVGVIAIRTGLTLYLDIAIALGLLGFLATIAFARYILTHAATGGRP